MPRIGSPRSRAGAVRKDGQGDTVARKGWGSVARKGATTMRDDDARPRFDERSRDTDAPERFQEQWVEVEPTAPPRSGGPASASASASASAEPFRLSPDAVKELNERAGKRAERLVRYLREASKAYAAERWGDVRKSLRPLLAEVPDAPSVQELNGMLLYRTGKWAAALKELGAAQEVTQSYELHPAMMDCARALRRFDEVEELWEDLRIASPGPEVLAEGRIVMAGALAEQGRLQDGIRLLEKASKARSKVRLHHLRSWYVLADLYERSGDLGTARTWFTRVASHDPELADVLHRIEALA